MGQRNPAHRHPATWRLDRGDSVFGEFTEFTIRLPRNGQAAGCSA